MTTTPDNPRLLSEFLNALVAAGEENQTRATAARTVWPEVFGRVTEFAASGAWRLDDHFWGQTPLAAAIPRRSYESGYLHREFDGEPIPWADPAALAPQIERWIPVASGHREPLDAIISFMGRLPIQQQAELGLPWIEAQVLADPGAIANSSFLLPEWLEQVRPHAISETLAAAWHRIVDALTVVDDHRVAALTD